MASALDYTYRYQQNSVARPDRVALVSSLDHRAERFFEGSLLYSQRTAELLLGLTDVVRSRFHIPAAMLQRILLQADPVITCHSTQIRFEAFSSCASVYGRLDLDAEALDGEIVNRGTTNVDFGPAMRTALARVRTSDPVRLSIGKRAVGLESPSGSIIERKVKLPLRWIKGFSEAGLYQARMSLWTEIHGATFRRFLRDLPSQAKGEFWVEESGLRVSQRVSPGAIAVGGLARLQLLRSLARHASSVCIYSGDGQATAWELRMPHARFLLVLSADSWRGFSGEGQALSALARTASNSSVARVRAALRWQGTVEEADEAALARCAASGLLGYDLSAGAWFHRELPFNVDQIDKLNPRLAAARLLVDAIEIESRSEDQVRAWVRTKDADHHVRFGPNPACTCPWFNKHGLLRGPCKHLLAVEMRVEDDARG